MHRTFLVSIASVFIVLASGTLPSLGQPSGRNADAVQETITVLEFQWAEAQKTGDPKMVAPLLTEDFVNTDTDGNVSGKNALLSNLKGGKWEHNEISGVKVTVHGTTAIATGTWEGKGVDGDGAKIDRREHWTDTWVRTAGGKWLCVASQQTEVKGK